VHLNYLPLRFTSDVFNGGVLEFENTPYGCDGKDSPLSLKLRELRHEHGDTHVFHSTRNSIACIPLQEDAPLLGVARQFTVLGDFQVANAVARASLHRFFKATGNHTVIGHRPITLLLTAHNLTEARPDVFGIFPEYTLDVRPLAPHEGDITSGVLVGFGVHYLFLKNAAELLQEGVPLLGLYVVRIREDEEAVKPWDRTYLGKIEAVSNGKATLSDSDLPEIPLADCCLEGSRTNVEAVGRALLGTGYDAFSKRLLKSTFEVVGAEHQVKRLAALGEWLEKKSPMQCGVGISLRIHRSPHECPSGTDAGTSHTFQPPNCVLRPGGSTSVRWPVDRQIDQHGPYDAESFPDKRVKVAVIVPSEFVGEAGQFLRQLKEGIQSADSRPVFRKGFVRKYHLNSCDFSFHEAKRSAGSIEEAYRTAALEAMEEKPHLALAVIREQHRELPDTSNPYYTTKARMMAQGVPVQLVEIETIRKERLDYILNNLSLAMYAKLGGIPWTLSPNPDGAHEIIVGIGSARLAQGRRGKGERVVGITTVFSGDGQYLLANNTQEVPADRYLEALTYSLNETVAELRSRFGWRYRDRVRFIFHQTFKKYKDIEAQAVKAFAESLSEFDVQYAFVHVSDSHNWMLFDPSNRSDNQGHPLKKGRMVPHRGHCVPLGPNTALLTLTGPAQVKGPQQGCPHPVLISIHDDSTFKSLDYLARQVFNLSFMSWRAFNPSTLPVSIAYSNMIVDLLAHLRHVKNWNPEVLSTALKSRRWFL